jgi:predicted GIY-YIG superfamily endonuclease
MMGFVHAFPRMENSPKRQDGVSVQMKHAIYFIRSAVLLKMRRRTPQIIDCGTNIRRGAIAMTMKRRRRKRVAAKAYLYLVRCGDGSLYTGIAREVEKRIALHNSGRGARYTRSRLPVALVYREGPMPLGRALRREHQLKQLARPQKEDLIAGRLIVPLRRRRGGRS